MKKTCGISIIIPTKDRAPLLDKCLESVIRQTSPAWECLVIDDGSGEEALGIQRKWADLDKRFRLVARPSGVSGGNACRNAGWRAASYPTIVFLDSDDVLSHRFIEGRLHQVSQCSSGQIPVANAELFDRVPGDMGVLWNVPTTDDPLNRFLKRDVPWQTSGPTWPVHVLEAIGGWDETLTCWQDWDIHVRALAAEYKFSHDAQCDYYYRADTSGRVSEDMFMDRDKIRCGIGLATKIESRIYQSDIMTKARRHWLDSMRLNLILKAGEQHGFRTARSMVGEFPANRRRGALKALMVSRLAWRMPHTRVHGFLMKWVTPEPASILYAKCKIDRLCVR